MEQREGGHYKIKYSCGPASNRLEMEVEEWMRPDAPVLGRAKIKAEDLIKFARKAVMEEADE